MSIWKLIDSVKNLLVYDADKEFYAKVFPHSVTTKDLMRLRRMYPEDLPAVHAIESNGYHFPWNEQLFTDCLNAANYSCWVCELDHIIMGYSVVSMAVGEAHIMNICVSPDLQKQGVGSKLLANIIARIGSKADTIFLEVRPSNQAAIALYKKRGFNEVGVRKAYYPALNGYRENAIILALNLRSLEPPAANN